MLTQGARGLMRRRSLLHLGDGDQRRKPPQPSGVSPSAFEFSEDPLAMDSPFSTPTHSPANAEAGPGCPEPTVLSPSSNCPTTFWAELIALLSSESIFPAVQRAVQATPALTPRNEVVIGALAVLGLQRSVMECEQRASGAPSLRAAFWEALADLTQRLPNGIGPHEPFATLRRVAARRKVSTSSVLRHLGYPSTAAFMSQVVAGAVRGVLVACDAGQVIAFGTALGIEGIERTVQTACRLAAAPGADAWRLVSSQPGGRGAPPPRDPWDVAHSKCVLEVTQRLEDDPAGTLWSDNASPSPSPGWCTPPPPPSPLVGSTLNGVAASTLASLRQRAEALSPASGARLVHELRRHPALFQVVSAKRYVEGPVPTADTEPCSLRMTRSGAAARDNRRYPARARQPPTRLTVLPDTFQGSCAGLSAVLTDKEHRLSVGWDTVVTLLGPEAFDMLDAFILDAAPGSPNRLMETSKHKALPHHLTFIDATPRCPPQGSPGFAAPFPCQTSATPVPRSPPATLRVSRTTRQRRLMASGTPLRYDSEIGTPLPPSPSPAPIVQQMEAASRLPGVPIAAPSPKVIPIPIHAPPTTTASKSLLGTPPTCPRSSPPAAVSVFYDSNEFTPTATPCTANPQIVGARDDHDPFDDVFAAMGLDALPSPSPSGPQVAVVNATVPAAVVPAVPPPPPMFVGPSSIPSEQPDTSGPPRAPKRKRDAADFQLELRRQAFALTTDTPRKKGKHKAKFPTGPIPSLPAPTPTPPVVETAESVAAAPRPVAEGCGPPRKARSSPGPTRSQDPRVASPTRVSPTNSPSPPVAAAAALVPPDLDVPERAPSTRFGPLRRYLDDLRSEGRWAPSPDLAGIIQDGSRADGGGEDAWASAVLDRLFAEGLQQHSAVTVAVGTLGGLEDEPAGPCKLLVHPSVRMRARCLPRDAATISMNSSSDGAPADLRSFPGEHRELWARISREVHDVLQRNHPQTGHGPRAAC